MRLDYTRCIAFTISDVKALDPVTVILFDLAPGKGRIVVECYGNAWSCYFGAIGKGDMAAFIASVGDDYLSSALRRSQSRTGKGEAAYLTRICVAVIDALKMVRASQSSPQPSEVTPV